MPNALHSLWYDHNKNVAMPDITLNKGAHDGDNLWTSRYDLSPASLMQQSIRRQYVLCVVLS